MFTKLHFFNTNHSLKAKKIEISLTFLTELTFTAQQRLLIILIDVTEGMI